MLQFATHKLWRLSRCCILQRGAPHRSRGRRLRRSSLWHAPCFPGMTYRARLWNWKALSSNFRLFRSRSARHDVVEPASAARSDREPGFHARDDGALPPDFDAAFYLRTHVDVAASGMDAAAHYLQYGRAEGRAFAPSSPSISAATLTSPSSNQPSPSDLGGEQSLASAVLLPYVTARLQHRDLFKTVTVVGSGPAAPRVADLLSDETIVVAINNAWRAVPRWDYSLYADDFPELAKPPGPRRARNARSSPQYWPAMNAFGGMLYCGASMGLAAGYWLLRTLPFSQISYYAADLVYDPRKSHFYGQGTADPLRRDISLQDHTAKHLRLFYFGLKQGCLFLNASDAEETRLPFPRVRSGASVHHNMMTELLPELTRAGEAMDEVAHAALALERAARFDWRSLDYWRFMEDAEAWRHVAEVDARWRALLPAVERIEQTVIEAFENTPPQPKRA